MEGLARLLPLLLASGQQEAQLVALTQQALMALLRSELGLKVYSQPDLAKFTLYSHYSYDQDRTKWDPEEEEDLS